MSNSNNGISIKHIFVNNINALRDKIKVLYNYLNSNINTEKDLINILEEKLFNFNPDIKQEINYLKVYYDADKETISEFFNEAKNIFKELKTSFKSLKNNFNINNNQAQFNLYPINLNNNNNNFGNFDKILNEIGYNNDELNLKTRSSTPVSITMKNNTDNYTASQNYYKKYILLQDEFANKNKEINNLKLKLKMLEENKNHLLVELNKIKNINKEYNQQIKELKKDYEDLQSKYNKLEYICNDFRSEDKKNSELIEEFNIKMIAKGAREKNRSQDMNIDNPGLQSIKDKYRNINYKYKTLVNLFTKLINVIKLEEANKNIINDIFKILSG